MGLEFSASLQPIIAGQESRRPTPCVFNKIELLDERRSRRMAVEEDREAAPDRIVFGSSFPAFRLHRALNDHVCIGEQKTKIMMPRLQRKRW